MRLGKYVIHNDPIVWKKASPNYRHRVLYDSQKPIKEVLACLLLDQHNKQPLFKGPLELVITFYMRLLKVSKRQQEQLLKKKWNYIKPDASNMLKLMEDICTSNLYVDDCQIASLVLQKIYDERPRTEFTLRELL